MIMVAIVVISYSSHVFMSLYMVDVYIEIQLFVNCYHGTNEYCANTS